MSYVICLVISFIAIIIILTGTFLNHIEMVRSIEEAKEQGVLPWCLLKEDTDEKDKDVL